MVAVINPERLWPAVKIAFMDSVTEAVCGPTGLVYKHAIARNPSGTVAKTCYTAVQHLDNPLRWRLREIQKPSETRLENPFEGKNPRG